MHLLSEILIVLVFLWPVLCSNEHAGNSTCDGYRNDIRNLNKLILGHNRGVYRMAIRSSMNPVSSIEDIRLWTLDDRQPDLKWRAFNKNNVKASKSTQKHSFFKRDATILVHAENKNSSAFIPYQLESKEPAFSIEAHEATMARMSSSSHLGSQRKESSIPIKHVLMVSYTSSSDFYSAALGKPIRLKRDMWATAYPQVKNFCKNLSKNTGNNGFEYSWNHISKLGKLSRDTSLKTLRILQYLGLPPVLPSKRTGVVSVWVDPADVFRPCLKPFINQTYCDTTFVSLSKSGWRLRIPGNYTARDFKQGGLLSHYQWFTEMATRSGIYRYLSGNLERIFPWTRLGFTFDYGGGLSKDSGNNNSSEPNLAVGATEFVIKSNSKVFVESVETIDQHCK